MRAGSDNPSVGCADSSLYTREPSACGQDEGTEERRKAEQKGKMARRLVYYCIGVLSVTAIWAAVIVTVAVVRDVAVDLSAVLTFIGAAFGGELLLLLLKRVFAKPTDSVE